MPKRVEIVWNAKKNMFLRNTNFDGLSRFLASLKLCEIARSSQFDQLWRGRFPLYTLKFWPLSRHTGHLWIIEIRQECVCCVPRYGWPNMAPHRDSPVFNFSESLTVTDIVSFQPTGLCFGGFVEPPTIYCGSKYFGDRLINGRAMARQTWPKIAKIQKWRHIGQLCRHVAPKRGRNSKIAVEQLLEEVQLC